MERKTERKLGKEGQKRKLGRKCEQIGLRMMMMEVVGELGLMLRRMGKVVAGWVRMVCSVSWELLGIIDLESLWLARFPGEHACDLR